MRHEQVEVDNAVLEQVRGHLVQRVVGKLRVDGGGARILLFLAGVILKSIRLLLFLLLLLLLLLLLAVAERLELEADDLTDGVLFGLVVAQQADECVVHERVVLERLEYDVEHAIRVEVEAADERLDVLQYERIELTLAELAHQLAVALGLLAQQVELLLLVANKNNSKFHYIYSSRATSMWRVAFGHLQ